MNVPRVSIVMPVRNEAGAIEHCLGAVLRQDYPPDKIEVLVVDGCSDDETVHIVDRLAADAAVPVTVLNNPLRVVSAGLNLGIQRAVGDVIVRVDGHCEIARDHVRRCVDALETTAAANVGGIQMAVGRTVVGRAIAAAMSSRFGVGDARFHYAKSPGFVDTVYLGAFRRDVFDRVGLFDIDLVRTQDSDFNFRLRRAGFKIWLDPAIQVRYEVRSSFRALARQYFSYGFYKALMTRKHRRVHALRQLVPPAFLLSLVFGGLVALLTRRPAVAVSVTLPYVVASVAASAAGAPRAPFVAALSPIAFATMHVSWGAGYLWGIFAKREMSSEVEVVEGFLA